MPIPISNQQTDQQNTSTTEFASVDLREESILWKAEIQDQLDSIISSYPDMDQQKLSEIKETISSAIDSSPQDSKREWKKTLKKLDRYLKLCDDSEVFAKRVPIDDRTNKIISTAAFPKDLAAANLKAENLDDLLSNLISIADDFAKQIERVKNADNYSSLFYSICSQLSDSLSSSLERHPDLLDGGFDEAIDSIDDLVDSLNDDEFDLSDILIPKRLLQSSDPSEFASIIKEIDDMAVIYSSKGGPSFPYLTRLEDKINNKQDLKMLEDVLSNLNHIPKDFIDIYRSKSLEGLSAQEQVHMIEEFDSIISNSQLKNLNLKNLILNASPKGLEQALKDLDWVVAASSQVWKEHQGDSYAHQYHTPDKDVIYMLTENILSDEDISPAQISELKGICEDIEPYYAVAFYNCPTIKSASPDQKPNLLASYKQMALDYNLDHLGRLSPELTDHMYQTITDPVYSQGKKLVMVGLEGYEGDLHRSGAFHRGQMDKLIDFTKRGHTLVFFGIENDDSYFEMVKSRGTKKDNAIKNKTIFGNIFIAHGTQHGAILRKGSKIQHTLQKIEGEGDETKDLDLGDYKTTPITMPSALKADFDPQGWNFLWSCSSGSKESEAQGDLLNLGEMFTSITGVKTYAPNINFNIYDFKFDENDNFLGAKMWGVGYVDGNLTNKPVLHVYDPGSI